MSLHYFKRLTIIALMVGYISLMAIHVGSKASYADSINPGVFALDSKPYGSSYEDWTIKFWQWLLPIPEDRSPVTDTTGERCGEKQNSTLPVFFLVFSGGGSAVRTCDVPAGKAIFVPINVVECSFAEFPAAKTEEELRTCAEEDESSNPGLFLSVDGKEFKDLIKYRVDSRVFDLNFSENNIFATEPGPTKAVSDGYWAILEPLSPGKHDIQFKASLTNPTTGILFYNDDLKYTVNVK